MLLFRLLISAIFYSTGDKVTVETTKAGQSPVYLPGVKDKSFVWTRGRLDSDKVRKYQCLHHGEDKTSPNSDRKDFTKTKESLCGIWFYCYVFCLFFFGSNVPAA